MTSPRSTQGGRPTFRRGGRRRRECFCKTTKVDYKDISNIRRFITDRGRIEPGKKSGNCAKCHRTLTTAIKRARHLALLPYAPHHLRVTGEVAVNKAKEITDASIDGSEESNEVTESAEQNQADVESSVINTDAEPELEIQSEASETIIEAKSDEEGDDEEGDDEDSNNVTSESGENTDAESDDSEEDK
jgi:small subunit ribosomal protein S18